MSTKSYKIAALVLGLLLAAGLAVIPFSSSFGYKVTAVMASAAQLPKGAPVWVNGSKVGEITGLETKGGKALVSLGLDGDVSPLHEGTTSRIEWKSALGERVVTLYPGPPTNPEIPEGGSFEGQSAQIEVDQVLAALDKPTRDKLGPLVQRANSTLQGHETDVRETLKTAGPAVEALGSVLKAVGTDGPALKTVVSQLAEMSRVAAQRQDRVRGVINNLSTLTSATAAQQEQLAASIGELPPTLTTAQQTLDRVPRTADATVPLLGDLRAPTAVLPQVSQNLSPLLVDLRPTVSELRPTLRSADALLGRTPGLLDATHGVIPGVSTALTNFGPALAFLRPYSPEAAGFLSNFGAAFAPKDAQGNIWAGLLAQGTNTVDESPTPVPLFSKTKDETLPGEIVGQPWTDANGSGVR